MPNAEKQNFEWQTITCPQCDGFGARNRPLVGEVECDRCDGAGEVQQKRTIEQSSTVAEVEQWAKDGCPEGVSGMPENVSAICATVKENLTIAERASDAITLLYTHGLLTAAMRDHARKKLANL